MTENEDFVRGQIVTKLASLESAVIEMKRSNSEEHKSLSAQVEDYYTDLDNRIKPLEKTYNYLCGAAILGGICGGTVLLFILPKISELIKILQDIHKIIPVK